MYSKFFGFALLVISLCCSSCVSHYRLTGVEGTRLVIDSRYDATHDKVVEMMMRPYKEDIDSLMNPVVGQVAQDMSVRRPESLLSNLLSDILVWSACRYHEQPDFAIYNMGGIRASLSKGEVTKGNVLDVAPFENKVCFLSLTGNEVTQLFRQIARSGGEGVSKQVRLVISPDGSLKSALLNGKQINPNATYRIVTLDYLAQGNDGLVAFKQATNKISPQEEQNNVRHLIENYFKEQQSKGLAVDAQIEGRIVVQ